MYVLSFVDNVNCFYSKDCIKESVEIVNVSKDVGVLRDSVVDVKWEKNEDGNLVGFCLFDDDEVEEEIYYVIIDVEELK